MKKLLAILLVLVMTFACATPAFAAATTEEPADYGKLEWIVDLPLWDGDHNAFLQKLFYIVFDAQISIFNLFNIATDEQARATREAIKGHTSGAVKWSVTKNATCTENGTQTGKCQYCDYSMTRTISAIGHNYKAEVIAPTLEGNGYTLHTCQNCGDSYKTDETVYADVWDGSVDEDDVVPEAKDEPVVDNQGNETGEVIKVIEISTADELAALAVSVNAGNSYAGYTVKLTQDIDLNNEEWTPIGKSKIPFSANFDGQGHTISNLKITKQIGNIAASNRQGLFGTIVPSGATYFKNLTLHNADIVAGYHVGAIIATSDSSSQTATGNYLTVSDLKLTGKVTVEGWEGVAGVMGSGNMYELSNIVVDVEEGSYVSNTVGGREDAFCIVGSVKGGGYLSVINNVSSNMDVRGKTASIGGLFGIVGGQNSVICNVSNVSYTGTVTVETSDELQWAYGRYAYNGLIIGAPRFNVVADPETCTSTGKLVFNLSDGTVKNSNDMSEAFAWGVDLFGASRDNAYTNKSYSKTYSAIAAVQETGGALADEAVENVD